MFFERSASTQGYVFLITNVFIMQRTLPILITCLGVILSLYAAAQEIEVTGKVTDDTGPLPGVNILIENTNVGTTTDMDGNYSIRANINQNLVFTYVGYKIKVIKIESSVINIQLLPEKITCWNSIPVYCVLTTTVNKVNGSFTNLNNEDFNQGNIYHPYQLIRGKVPGLTIAKPGGDPLGVYDVYQRGQHSLLGKTEPLIVLDGLPGASLQSIDPQDIESITALRDASMTASYGARGANGVLIIKSREARYLEPCKITYNGYITTEQIANTPDVLSADSYRTLLTNPNSSFYNPASDLGASTDWADAITRAGMSHAHQLAFRGSAKNTRYSLSLNYRDVNGAVKNSGFNQTSALLHLSQDLFKNKVNIRANGGITQRNFTEIDKDIFYYAAIYNPTAPIRTDTSSIGGYFQQQFFDYSNPVGLLEQIDNQGEKDVYTIGLQAKWNIVNGLNAQLQYGWQQQHYNRAYRVDENIYPLSSTGHPLYNYNTELDLNNQSLNTSLVYNFYKNDHNFSISGGYHYQKWTNELYNADDYDVAVNDLQYADVSFNAQPDTAAIAYKNTTLLAAFFGHLQYDYDNWLFLNAHLRREGSTRFGDNNKWGSFYGFGAGVDFAALGEWTDIQQFKLRSGYGLSGNLPVDGVYAKGVLRPSGKTFFNGSYIDIYTPSVNENQDLKWEERREWNIGLDAYLFDNKLFMSIDWYRARTEDMIYNFYVNSPPNIASSSYINAVDFKNHGIEIGLYAYLFNRRNFSWEFGINYAADRAKLAEINAPQGTNQTQIAPPVYLGTPGFCCNQYIILEKGKRVGNFVGWQFERFENGNMIFKDRNNDNVITEEDRMVIGNALPDFTFGIYHQFRYKQLEFNFLLRGVIGHDIMNTHRAFYNFPGNITIYNVLQTAIEGENSQVPFASGLSSYNVEDASFVTLENLVIAYQFNAKKAHFSRLKMYVAAQNLFTLSGYSGNDPEVRFKNRAGRFHTGNALTPGFDVRVGYYPTRTFTLGVQAEF